MVRSEWKPTWVGNHLALELGNDLTLELGNHLAPELGNDLALELGNDLTLELGNHLTLELGNDLALQSSIVGNIRGPRHVASGIIQGRSSESQPVYPPLLCGMRER
jgi:hypothetical protein